MHDGLLNISSQIISTLRACKSLPSLPTAKIVHARLLRSGADSDPFLCNNLLRAYWLCGSNRDAMHLFDGMPLRDAVSWNTMVSGFVASRRSRDAFCFFREMVRTGHRPTQSSFVSILVAAAEVEDTPMPFLEVHGFSLKSGFTSDSCVGNILMRGYAELGGFNDMRKLSEEMSALDEISYEILLRGCLRHGALDDAFQLFMFSCRVGVNFSAFAFSSLLSLCTCLQSIKNGTQIHGRAVKVGLDVDVSVVNALITMYARSNSLRDAGCLFEWSESRDIVTWNSLISGCAYNGEGVVGIYFVARLLSEGFRMNESTFFSFLSCCAPIRSLENAKKAHGLILKLRDHVDQGSCNTILTMYCRCESLKEAVVVFKAMEICDIVSVNLMVGLYRRHGSYEEAIQLFHRAQFEDLGVDEVMLAGVISCCSKLGHIDLGRNIHGFIVKSGFEVVVLLKNSLLEMHSQSGTSDDMEKIFEEIEKPDVFSWNTLLLGYTHFRSFEKVIRVWKEMETLSIMLNEFSYSALLDACTCFNSFPTGEQIHACIHKRGLIFDTPLMNSLLTTYSNCQMTDTAFAVFKEIFAPDSVSWNAMVSCYTQNGFPEASIKFFIAMNKNGVETNDVTFASLCMSCAMLTEIKLGLQCHSQVIKRAFEFDTPVSNSFITMYSKCGDMNSSFKVFCGMAHKDVITWNSMICAYAHHGIGRNALDTFVQMISSGLKPNDLTFVGLLSACSRSGLVVEACDMFKYMYADFAIVPNEEHYSCMVDILCRAGSLAEARDLIESMPVDNCSLVWKTLLGACKANENIQLGEMAARRILHLEPKDSAAYVLLSDLYISVGNRNNKAEIRRLMREQGVRKEVGCSWISG